MSTTYMQLLESNEILKRTLEVVESSLNNKIEELQGKLEEEKQFYQILSEEYNKIKKQVKLF
jgi:hypothetical protein